MRVFTFPALLLSATLAAGADLTIRQKVTTSGGPAAGTREETVYVTGTQMVVDGDRDRTIVDLPAKTITLVDKGEKTWFTVGTDQLRAQAEAVQQELRRQMADMQPEARAAMEKMLGGAESGGPVVTPTGKRETIAGYEAVEYRVQAGAFSGSVWASDRLPMPAGLAQWKEMALAATPAAGPGRPIAEAFAKVPGYPMRTTMTGRAGRDEFTSTTEVTGVREGPPPADVLAVPEGFRKTEPPAMGAPSPRARAK